MFAILPREILKYELLPLLDDASLLCLQIALHVRELPLELEERLQCNIVKHGLRLTQYFDDRSLMNRKIMGIHAVGCNQVTVLEYVIRNGYVMDEHAGIHAAENGCLEALKCLYENGYTKWSGTVIHTASKMGHVDCLSYLLEIFDEYNQYIAYKAIEAGQLECLDILRLSTKTYFDGMTYWEIITAYPTIMYNVAINHLQLSSLIYLKEHTGYWNKDECLKITTEPEIIEWILSQE